MPARLIQNNFSGGEISPVLHGRSDLQAYYKGCASAENFVVSKEGTLRKRRGLSTFLQFRTTDIPSTAAQALSYDEIRVVPYRFDRTNGGFLILAQTSNTTMHVFYYTKDGMNYTNCQIRKKTDGAWTSFSNVVSWTISGSVKNIQSKQIGDQIWLTNGSFFCIVQINNNTSAQIYTWSDASKPAAPTTISASKTNFDHTNRTVRYAAYGVKGGVLSNRTQTSIKINNSWPAGAYVTITITLPSGWGNYDYFILAKQVGSTYGEIARWYPEDITSGATTATFTDENVSAGEAVYAQTDVLGEGFTNPVCVDCFQQRRVFANATTDGKKYPMTLWFSEVGNLSNFWSSRPTVDSDAFSPTISSTGPAFIRWICTFQESIILFTDCGLFTVGFTQTSGFSAQACRISKFSDLAVAETIQPIVTDAGIVFVGADRKTVYTVSYNLEDNSMKPVNRTVLVEHLTRSNRIVAMALQEYPDSVVWMVLEDGTLATFTYERNEDVYAWSHGRIDGARALDVISLGSVTDGVNDRTYTDLVFVVEKTVVDTTTQYLARPVQAYSDTVGGVPTPVVAELRTLRPESQERTLAGYAKNVKDVLVRLYETGSLKVVPAQAGASVPLVKAKTGTNGLFTGDVKVMPHGFVNADGQMTFVSDDATPCEILMVVNTVEV